MNLNNGQATVNLDPYFKETLEDEVVKNFLSKFKRWNKIAYPIMNDKSNPYISMQDSLVELVNPYVREAILDDGCGDGTLTAKLIQKTGKSFNFIVGTDPDPDILQNVPTTLTEVGFHNKLALIRTSSMTPSILPNQSVGTIISGLGGVAYSGRFLEPTSNGSESHIFTGKDALTKCLKERYRILQPSGILAFSSLVPEPDFKTIRKETILSALRKREFENLIELLLNANRVEKISSFFKKYAQSKLAQYLKIDEWEKVLNKTGFELLDTDKAYADQGVVLVARKR